MRPNDFRTRDLPQNLALPDWVQQISPLACLNTGRCAESVAFFPKFGD
jgi:hypothetical protein